MDRKIRIHFFPRDASRVSVVTFSRTLGLAAVGVALPLCFLGFWLVLSGTFREDPARRLERSRQERENRALREKIEVLRRENTGLTRGLDSLESARLRALAVAGFDLPQTGSSEARSGFLGLLGFAALPRPDFNRDLARARGAGLFFDSALFILSRDRGLADRLPTGRPIDARALILRPFGTSPDPFTGRRNLHAGVDFSFAPGAPVFAAGGGTVAAAGQSPIWGNFVRLRHTERVETFYAHLQEARVRAGARVTRGQIVGIVGQSGIASGPHLHFEILLQDERVDPMPYLLSHPARAGAP